MFTDGELVRPISTTCSAGTFHLAQFYMLEGFVVAVLESQFELHSILNQDFNLLLIVRIMYSPE